MGKFRMGARFNNSTNKFKVIMPLKQLQALRGICCAVIEAVEECGHTGAPAGVLYSVLSAQGCNQQQFDSLMRGLVATGYLRKVGLVYFASGKEIGAVPAAAAPAAAVSASPRGWDSVNGGGNE